MKSRFLVPMVVGLLAVGCGANAFAQPAGDTGAPMQPAQQMDQRFQHMNTMMGQAQNAQGPQRMELMQKHMQLMQEQMQSMHSMMRGKGMMASMGGGAMGMMEHMKMRVMDMMLTNMERNTKMIDQMQTRMDMMQRMMEQMLDQQKMMMQTPKK